MNPPASSESHWTDSISNATLCNFFYVFFVIFMIWGVIGLIGMMWLFVSTPMKGSTMIALLFNLVITSGISITAALFHYLVCDRALNPSHNPGSEKHMRLQTMSQYDSL